MNVSSILKETKLLIKNHKKFRSFLKENRKQKSSQRNFPYIFTPTNPIQFPRLNTFSEYQFLAENQKNKKKKFPLMNTTDNFYSNYKISIPKVLLTETSRPTKYLNSFSSFTKEKKLNQSMYRFQNDIFDIERYSNMIFDESEIYNKRPHIKKLIEERIEHLIINGSNNNKTEIFKTQLYSNHLTFILTFKSLRVSFIDFNTNDTIFYFYLPFSLLPIFYFQGFEFFQIILTKIIKFETKFKKFEVNEAEIYSFLKKKFKKQINIQKFTRYNTSVGNISPRGKGIRKSCIADSQYHLIDLKVPDNNIKDIKISQEKKERSVNNVYNSHIYSFSWVTPVKYYTVKIETPQVILLENSTRTTIEKFIDYDLLFYLYEKHFQVWDFYVLNHLFSFKECRLLMDRLLSKNTKIIEKYQSYKLKIGKEKTIKYQESDNQISYISTNELGENYFHQINPIHLKITVLHYSNSTNDYQYSYIVTFNFSQMRKIFEGLTVVSVAKIQKILLKFSEIKEKKFSFDFDKFDSINKVDWKNFLLDIKNSSKQRKDSSVFKIHLDKKESDNLLINYNPEIDKLIEKISVDLEDPELKINTIDDKGNITNESFVNLSHLFKKLFKEPIEKWPKISNDIVQRNENKTKFDFHKIKKEDVWHVKSPVLSPKRFAHRKSMLI